METVAEKLQKEFGRLKEIRRNIAIYGIISWHDREYLDAFSNRIVEEGLDSRGLSTDELMAAIFLVARQVHNRHQEVDRERRGRAIQLKLMLQLELLDHAERGCEFRINFKPRLAQTIEVSYDIWSTHVPSSLHHDLYRRILSQTL